MRGCILSVAGDRAPTAPSRCSRGQQPSRIVGTVITQSGRRTSHQTGGCFQPARRSAQNPIVWITRVSGFATFHTSLDTERAHLPVVTAGPPPEGNREMALRSLGERVPSPAPRCLIPARRLRALSRCARARDHRFQHAEPRPASTSSARRLLPRGRGAEQSPPREVERQKRCRSSLTIVGGVGMRYARHFGPCGGTNLLDLAVERQLGHRLSPLEQALQATRINERTREEIETPALSLEHRRHGQR